MKNGLLVAGLIVSGLLLLGTLVHIGYMKATSYECTTTLPPKPFLDSDGEEYYVGSENYIQEIECTSGIFAKLNKDYPLR